MSASDSRSFRVGDWLVEPKLDRMSRGGSSVSLRPQVMELLVYLAERPGRVVSGDELLDDLWTGKVVTSSTMYNCIAELRHVLEDADGATASIETIPKRGYRLLGEVKGLAGSPAAAGRWRWAIGIAGAAAVATVGVYFALPLPGSCEAPDFGETVRQFPIDVPRSSPFLERRSVAISPDGRYLILSVRYQHGRRLYSRSIDSLHWAPIRGTVDVEIAFGVSPDGEWIAYFDEKERTLNKVPVQGGVPVTLASLDVQSGGRPAWSAGGKIAYSSWNYDGLMQVSASGGAASRLTVARDGEVHKQPRFLPSGDALLFTIGDRGVTPRHMDRIAVLSLETGEQKVLISGSSPMFAAESHLVYYRDGSLWAAEFDSRRLEVIGESVVVAESVRYTGTAAYDISADGTLVYLPVYLPVTSSLVLVDRQGNEEILPFDRRPFQFPRMAPGGERIAVTIDGEKGRDLWIYSLASGASTRMTFDESGEVPGAWDNEGFFFYYSDNAIDDIFRIATSGTGVIEQLTETPTFQYPSSITPDGRQLIYSEFGTATQGDLAVLELDGAATSSFVLQTPNTEKHGQVSPDGHWLAYTSDRSGQQEIYLRRFPVEADAPAWQISVGGGEQPRWSPDGREIYYWGATEIMAVRIQAGSDVLAQLPEALFSHRDYRYDPADGFDVSRSDGRFLFVRQPAEEVIASEKIIVVQNWLDDVSCRLAAQR